jgi:CubicO group peptidase (beta-lactamase class C family)
VDRGLTRRRGDAAGIDAPVLPFFPEDFDLHAPQEAAITVHVLLRMTS